ncbi:methyltransferase domain-containing protein [Amycolatopsis anabasis]|uniref:methyltransferase domain-containing protein n=1 Tax=Amycolatopsis anabasis TaxID=1840409 RepID=UPI00131C499B|nr:methyltransferase domain-containing protein [Amycolatopsis anabasis]
MTTTELADQLTASGQLPETWRAAFSAVPREWFIPARIWVDDDDSQPVAIDRGSDGERWRAAVYANQPILTQFDDGRTQWPDTGGTHCTSSASKPSLVLNMLDALDVQEGNRVLEVGTGTGYNAALLAARLGPDRVVTVEVDPALAAAADRRLTEHDIPVAVLHADGEAGYPPAAPFDRIIATASVRLGLLPNAWVSQTRIGGVIVAPLTTEFAAGSVLMRFTVEANDTAIGKPVGVVAFMPLRQHRTSRANTDELAAEATEVRESVTRLRPWKVAETWDARWAVGLQVPGCAWHHERSEPDGQHVLWLVDGESKSWARVWYSGSSGPRPVRQAGPRDLWAEVERAFRRWKEFGKPAYRRFGLTVTPDRQEVWLDEPGTVFVTGAGPR